MQNSSITANAFAGPGGNITLIADHFLIDSASLIEAKSALSVDGNVEVESPDSDVTSDLAALSQSFLDASALLKDACAAAQAGGEANRLAIAGRGGLAEDPSGYLASGTGAGPGDLASLGVSAEGLLAMVWNPPTCAP
jgi:large exoprotein involved in heme utilization and adhesion